MRTVLATSFFIALVSSLGQVEGAIKKVSSSAELQSALDGARPGDTIQLASGVYEGDYVASGDGPVTVTGDANSTIVSEGTGFTLRGNKWTLKSIYIKEANIAVLVEGNENNVEHVVIQKVGQGIVVKGQHNKMKSVVISEASGGIIIEADNNQLFYNSVNIQAPSITLEENTCCGFLDGNVANGRVDVKGSKYNFTGNVANHGMYVTGCDNSFSGNVANGASFPKECATHDLGGNVYRGLGPNDTDPPQPGQQQQQSQNNHQQQQGSYQQQGNNYNQHNGQQSGGGQSFPAAVTGSSEGKMPTCTCTCV
ncbi:uncharacterized protein LOC110859395 [Folsomia candida]|uniref:uncharacterized protein LOC110859395 n=1 Tax=Folsomia candida TaxID=158441 RepID=UPI000B8FBF47|nr:uncharacterized protein LOC110859395 [Folsomia candida]